MRWAPAMVGGAGRPAGVPEAAELGERLLPLPSQGSGDADGGGRTRGKWEKTYLDVLGVCCSAEAVLVERLLSPIDGVRAVTVVVPSRTVVVEHDPAAVSHTHIGNRPLLLHHHFLRRRLSNHHASELIPPPPARNQ